MEEAYGGSEMRKHYLLAGVLATLFFGVGKGLLTRWGIDGDVCDLTLIPVITIVLFALFKESFHVEKKSFFMLLIGLAVGCIYYVVRYRHEIVSVQSSNGGVGVLVYLVNSAVIIPVFEEKVVRKLLFFGLSSRVGLFFSGFLISAVFGVAHAGNVIFAFLFSLLMCFLAVKRIDTFNRSLLHGGFNLSLNGMLVLSGYTFG